MFIDTDPIKKIYLIEFRSSVAKFYCRNSIKQTVIEFYRNPSNVDFFWGPLFYDIAREMDQFFFLHARVMAFMDANSIACTIGIGLGLMGTRFHRFYRSM